MYLLDMIKIGFKFPKRKQTNLETDNAMFKEAFMVKKTKFAKENPTLSETEINKMTAEYFKSLPDTDAKIRGRTI